MADEQRDTQGVRPFRWEEREFDEPAGQASDAESTPGGAVLAPEKQAEQLLAEARAEAEAMLAGARAEATEIKACARQEGMVEGRAAGAAAATVAADRLEAMVEELAGYKGVLYAEARQQVLELTLALVSKLLGPLVADLPDAVVRVVERSLQLLSDREQLTVRVHPEDLKVLLDAKPKLLENVDGIQKLTVLEDPSVKPGGCLVQTPTTEIDARLETQLQELARSIRSL